MTSENPGYEGETGQRDDWRVKLWFLDIGKGGWVGLEFAFVEAADEHHAVAYSLQRAFRLGFSANRDTQIEAWQETGGHL